MINDKKRHIADCLVITAALIIIGILKELEILLYIAAGLAIASALIPFIAKAISYAWQGIGKALGFIVSKIVLGSVFYFILFPISLLQKLFSKNNSIMRNKSKSYWINIEKKEIDFNKPW